MYDSSYFLVLRANEPCETNGYIYANNYSSVTTGSGNTLVNMTLETEFVGFKYNPIIFTFRSDYDNGLIDSNYLYITA
jgi:hypothetical protein